MYSNSHYLVPQPQSGHQCRKCQDLTERHGFKYQLEVLRRRRLDRILGQVQPWHSISFALSPPRQPCKSCCPSAGCLRDTSRHIHSRCCLLCLEKERASVNLSRLTLIENTRACIRMKPMIKKRTYCNVLRQPVTQSHLPLSTRPANHPLSQDLMAPVLTEAYYAP